MRRSCRPIIISPSATHVSVCESDGSISDFGVRRFRVSWGALTGEVVRASGLSLTNLDGCCLHGTDS
eukprot:358549-Pleurochrysis_carterae.AAC.2